MSHVGVRLISLDRITNSGPHDGTKTNMAECELLDIIPLPDTWTGGQHNGQPPCKKS